MKLMSPVFKDLVAVVVTLVSLLQGSYSQALASHQHPTDPQPSPPKIEELLNYDEGNLQLFISKKALEHSFLLQADTVLPRPKSKLFCPPVTATKSKIIKFVQIGERIFVQEDNRGHLAFPSLDATSLLANLPITKTTDNGWYVLWEEGLRGVFSNVDYYPEATSAFGQDEKDARAKYLYDPYFHFTQNEFKKGSNAVTSIALEPKHLWITESARLRKDNSPITVHYYLSTYQKSKTFRPVKIGEISKIQMFAAQSLRNPDDTEDTFVAKIDENKTFTFHYTSNFPQEAIPALRDAIAHLNKTFGHDVLDLKPAPQGINAPHPSYNLIEYLHSKNWTGAYATLASDPLTGEVLRGNIYFASGVLIKSKLEARASLKSLLREVGESPSDSESQSINTFMYHLQPPKEQEIARLGELLSLDLTDEQIFQMSLDRTRTLATHEIMHVLGFGHNYAGSLTTNVPNHNRIAILESYARTHATTEVTTILDPDMVFASTVMDYHTWSDRYLIGQQIETGNTKAFQYDQMAIDLVYNNAQPKETIPYSCNHSETNKYVDCKWFDSGRSFLEDVAWKVPNSLKMLPNKILLSYLANKFSSEEHQTVAIHNIDPAGPKISGFEPVNLVDDIFKIRRRVIWAFKDFGKILAARQDYYEDVPLDTLANASMFRDIELAYLAKEIDRVSEQVLAERDESMWRSLGIDLSSDTKLNLILPRVDGYTYASWARNRLKELLRQNFDSGSDGTMPINFSEQEIEAILANTEGLFKSLPRAIHDYDIEHVFKQIHDSSGTIVPQYAEDGVTPRRDDVTKQLARVIADRIVEYSYGVHIPEIGSGSETQLQDRSAIAGQFLVSVTIPDANDGAEVFIPYPKYHYKTRQNANLLLGNRLYPGGKEVPFWGIGERVRLRREFDSRFEVWHQIRRSWRGYINESKWDAAEYELLEYVMPEADQSDQATLMDWFKQTQELCLSVTEINAKCWW